MYSRAFLYISRAGIYWGHNCTSCWIRFLPSMDSSSIKPFFILLASQIISSNRIKNLNFSHAISFLLLSVIIIFLVEQPDLGQSVLIFCTWLSLIFVSGMNIYFLVVLFITVILAFFSLITCSFNSTQTKIKFMRKRK